MATELTGTLSAAGVSPVMNLEDQPFGVTWTGVYSITSSSFVGTWQLERAATAAGTAWYRVTGAKNAGADGHFYPQVGNERYRIRVLTYVSGSIGYSLSVPTKEEAEAPAGEEEIAPPAPTKGRHAALFESVLWDIYNWSPGAAVDDSDAAKLVFSAASQDDTSIHSLVTVMTASSGMWTIKFKPYIPVGDYLKGGVVFLSNTGGQYLTCGPVSGYAASGSSSVQVIRWANFTSGNSSLKNSVISTPDQTNTWMRAVIDDAGNHTFWTSADGAAFTQIGSGNITSAQVGLMSHVGIFIDPATAGGGTPNPNPAKIDFLGYEYVADFSDPTIASGIA